jgi:superfamily II DNA or RNA helicase
VNITLPDVFSIDQVVARNQVRRLAQPSAAVSATVATYQSGSLRGHVATVESTGVQILIIPTMTKAVPTGFTHVIGGSIEQSATSVDLSARKWIRHPLQSEQSRNRAQLINDIRDSWIGAFTYNQENIEKGVRGLRSPQLGALHAVNAHWTVSSDVATIVLPTGVGKTETMLAILITAQCERLAVVVPTDALRTQIANKFSTLGHLKNPGLNVLRETAQRPIVCTLEHVPKSASELSEIVEKSQVIVMTSAIAGASEDEVRERLAQLCPYLFIDEAHHAEAPTWRRFKDAFRSCRVVQFTATPFRDDEKPLDGIFIYKYSLRQAQKDGYFKPIHYKPVTVFDKSAEDFEIAKQAVEVLREDKDKGHILMARVGTVARAKTVYEIYRQYPDFNPVQIHTGMTVRQRETSRQQLLSGSSQIVVCVDMLGEGFDLPELKIAAFHDIRKSLAVTLQLAGRFTRTRPDLGDATFIANDADLDVREELQRLYTRDPDWNLLLPDLAEAATGEQAALQDLIRGFSELPQELSLSTVRPATSTVVYRNQTNEWFPDEFRKGIPQSEGCERIDHTINTTENMLVAIAIRKTQPIWTNAENLSSWTCELYIVLWHPESHLLYINSSTNLGTYDHLAAAVTRGKSTLIKGDDVFRAFADLKRLQFHNVGTTEHRGRNVSFMSRMGGDVEPAMTAIQKGRARKAVLDGRGFEGGGLRTMGASRKGRVWSHDRGNLAQFAAWCKRVGAKLVDTSLDPTEILKGTLETQILTARPEKMPISIDWPREIYTEPERNWWFAWDDREYSLDDLTIQLISPTERGALLFEVFSDLERVEFELEFFQSATGADYRFLVKGDEHLYIKHGESAKPKSLADFFAANPPKIWFFDGSSLEGDEYVELGDDESLYDPAKIITWDWTGIDLRKESQGKAREADSVQAFAISKLITENYEIVFDDDGSGEVADIVCIRLTDESQEQKSIFVHLFHCKYAHSGQTAARIDDLYEVCGQAQKSVLWADSATKKTDLFTHLLRREGKRKATGGTRIEKGTEALIKKIRDMSRIYQVSVSVSIVQPGVGKSSISIQQRKLLGVTENHLVDMYQIPLAVIASA